MTDTNGSATATVQTLTAEVRVLMVGSRQVTLSVAKQLDTIPLAQLRPFGRVSLTGIPNTVIGADTETGALCLSHARCEIDRRAWPVLTEHPGKLKPLRCRQQQPNGDGHNQVGRDEVALSFGPENWPIGLLADDMEDRHGEHPHKYAGHCYISDCQRGPRCTGFHCGDECAYWDPRDYRDEITRQVQAHIEQYREDQHRVAAAKELPLIVLAGLR